MNDSGPVHTETFSCFFVLFRVTSWLFSIPLRTVNNTKTQGNVSERDKVKESEGWGNEKERVILGVQ